MVIAVIRCTIPAVVRKAPATVSGTSKRTGNAYSFLKVELLDDDYNKFDATLADNVQGSDHLQAGAKVVTLCDVSANGGFTQVKVLAVSESVRSDSGK